ncbi:MAG: zinc-dependent alcohol dehydrogenase family protein [Alphaproteobacteria bacterium]|nr:zinc-dependent alcohol dehydrogenase family protein [Alphaproteobacteria bacterium]
MRAMRLHQPGSALVCEEIALPAPGPGQVAIRVAACAVCRTDLHVVDGELPPRPEGAGPLIPGHEIVGRVVARGPGATRFAIGDRIGVPWLGWSCGTCAQCRAGRENLCDAARFTGYTLDGGYAEGALAHERFCVPIPPGYGDAEAAPLLCAGLIGWRCLKAAGPPEEAARRGLYGFGAAAHIIAQVARWQGRTLYGFTRPGDHAAQDFARRLGCAWAGGSDQAPPEPLDAAIIFAPVGALVPAALAAVRKGGRVVCGGIHMSDIPSFPYSLLWGERHILSVANLTRADGEEFMAIAPKVPVRTCITRFPLERANEALARLRAGELEGAAVLLP